MTTLGIIGAGIAGLHLALYLQQQGISVTLYSEHTPEEMRATRLPNTQALMGPSRIRDRALGTNHFDEPDYSTTALRLQVAGDPPLVFTGKMGSPSLFIDMRLYLPRALEDFAARGGRIVIGPCKASDVDRLAANHELMVVATGRGGLSAMFPRMPERSPYEQPQRLLIGGMFRGITVPRPCAFGYNIIPGHGEMFELHMVTKDGCMTTLLIEAIPGGVLEPLTRLRYDGHEAEFNAAFLAAVREHAPDTYARTDPAAFGLSGPLDVLTGSVTPTARRGYVPLSEGRFAMALGDSFVAFDPITGLGGNAASRSAFLLGELLTAHRHGGGRFDQDFCAQAEQRLWECVRASCEWTNAFLQPPPPHVLALLGAASQNQALADAFVSNWEHADSQWAILSSPEATANLIASAGASLY